MARTSKRVRTKRQTTPQYFIFEIAEWQPTYILSVNHDRYRDSAYREHAGIELQASCIFPRNLAGRVARFNIAGQRDCLMPEVFKRDSSWTPRCVGALELKPSQGHFYTSVPHESLPFLTTLFSHGAIRFVVLYGASMSRGRSLCSSFQLERAVNLEDY